MSYDLFFRSRPGETRIDAESFRAYFSGRRNYEVREKQAWYSNEDTGIYFSFDLADPSSADDPGEGGFEPEDASFNLNYYRPHTFGLEAEPEVAAFLSAFHPFLEDPQIGGMGEGEYSRDRFLEGWNRGNKLAYSSVPAHVPPDEPPRSLPAALLEAYWRWNRERSAVQERTGPDVFIPRVMFSAEADAVQSFVVWIDAIPACLPRVDFILVAREELAPRGFLRRKADFIQVSWSDASEALCAFPERTADHPVRALEYVERPPSLLAWVRGLSPTDKRPTLIAPADVLDRELLESARTNRA